MLRSQASLARLLLAALLCGGCATLGLRQKEPPPPPPPPAGTPLAPEPVTAEEEPLPVTPVAEPIVVAAWAEPKELPAGGGQAQIMVRIQRLGGKRFPGVEVRLRSSGGTLFSGGPGARDRRLGHDARPADGAQDGDDHAQRRRDPLPLPGAGRGGRAVSGPVLREPDRRVVEDLERMLAPERVLSRPIDRLGRSADASIYRLIPEAIVRPRGLGEVESLFAWARQKRRHLTFRTAGTSLSGQAVTDDVLVELGPFFRSARVLDDGARVWSRSRESWAAT